MVNEEYGPAIVKEVAPDKSGKYDGVQFHKTYEVLLSAGHPAINHRVTEGSTKEAHLVAPFHLAYRMPPTVHAGRSDAPGSHAPSVNTTRGRTSLTYLYAPRLA